MGDILRGGAPNPTLVIGLPPLCLLHRAYHVAMPTFALSYIVLPAIVLLAILTPLALSLREQYKNKQPPRDEGDDSSGGSAPRHTPPLQGDSSSVNARHIEISVPGDRKRSPQAG